MAGDQDLIMLYIAAASIFKENSPPGSRPIVQFSIPHTHTHIYSAFIMLNRDSIHEADQSRYIDLNSPRVHQPTLSTLVERFINLVRAHKPNILARRSFLHLFMFDRFRTLGSELKNI